MLSIVRNESPPEDAALLLTESALRAMAALQVAVGGLEQIAHRGGDEAELALSTMRRVKAAMVEDD